MRNLLCISALLAAMTSTVWAADNYTAINEAKIVAGTGVRVRAEPNVAAKEVGQLTFGTIFTSPQRTSSAAKVGPSSSYWYNVTSPMQGWVFGGFLQSTDAKHPDAAALALLRSKLGAADTVIEGKTLRFSDAVEISQFADKATQAAQDQDSKGELALDHWRAVQASFNAINVNELQKPAYTDWFKAQGDKVFYHELAGGYYVKADTLWGLADQFKANSIGDAIAWQAANAALGGECEGFIDCGSGRAQMTDGEYLVRFPNGKHAADALKNINETLVYSIKDAKNQHEALQHIDFAKWEAILKPLPDSKAKTQAQQYVATLQKMK